MKGCLQVFLSLIFLAALIGVGIVIGQNVTDDSGTPTPSAGPRAIPTLFPQLDVKWTVLSDEVKAGSDYRFVEVVLDTRLSEEELRDLAWQISRKSPDHPVIHILYWIEGMSTEAIVWATTRFETGSALAINIRGLTPAERERVLAEPPPDAQRIIGRWFTDQFAVPGIATIYLDEQGAPFIHHVYPSASVRTYELSETPTTDGRRFDYVVMYPTNYLIVEPSPKGRLGLYGESGIFAIGIPVEPLSSPTPIVTPIVRTPAVTSTPETTPTPPPIPATPDEYVVQAGDTLRSIAEEFGITVDDLIGANDLEDADLIRTGSTLLIPIPTTAVADRATTPEPTRTRAPSQLTADEHLEALTFCYGSVRVEVSIRWGQAPWTIYSENLGASGWLLVGDGVHFRYPWSQDSGKVRVEVLPHDGRVVGGTFNKVWIDWGELTQDRHDLVAFTCLEE